MDSLENAAEIEITPEMIEAGVLELSFYDPEHDDGFEFVTRLYRIMESERHSHTGRKSKT